MKIYGNQVQLWCNNVQKTQKKQQISKPELSPKQWVAVGKLLRKALEISGYSRADVRTTITANNWSPVGERTLQKALNGEKVKVLTTLRNIALAIGFADLNDLFEAAKINIRVDFHPIIQNMRREILEDHWVSHLPSLFGSDEGLPIDKAYIELRLSSTTKKGNPNQLEQRRSMQEQLDEETFVHFLPRLNLKEALDNQDARHTLILGAPGSGKTSLLRRLTLEIAGKQWADENIETWEQYELPILITLREYWAEQKMRPNGKIQSIQNYGQEKLIDRISKGRIYDKKTARTRLHSSMRRIVFLLDGLDEVSNDPQAVRAIYEQLQRADYNWIVTCRPAGLMGNLRQTKRFDLLGLDAESIEELIANWARFSQSEHLVSKLTAEIRSSEALQSMAKNPFLLTAMIFVKQYRPKHSLPLTRIKLYERLIRTIAQVAKQDDTEDRNILSLEAQQDLANFSYHLFDKSCGVQHYFTDEDWDEYFSNRKSLPVLKKQILPARLLDSKPELKEYCFLHLSLQEHFISRAMQFKPIKEVWEKRLIPSWNNAFVSYGALLYTKGKTDKFRYLVTKLYNEIDYAGLQLILLAQIFGACGIKCTKKWIGADLRDILYGFCSETYSDHHHFMINAISEIDPQWLEKKVLKEFNDPEYFEDFGGDEHYPGEDYSTFGSDIGCPYFILSKTRTAFAKKTLQELFWGANQQHAMLAAPGFARLSSLKDRREVVAKGLSVDETHPMFSRVFAFCHEANSPQSVPFFEKVVETSWWAREEMRDAIIFGIQKSGGEKAYAAFEKISKHVMKTDKNFQTVKEIMANLSRLGGYRSEIIFNSIQQYARELKFESNAISKLVKRYKIEAGIASDSQIFKGLANDEAIEGILKGLSGSALNGHYISDSVLSEIKSKSVAVLSPYLDLLTHIEAGRPFSENTTSLAKPIVEICRYNLDILDPIENSPFYTYHLGLAFDALEKIAYYDIEDIVDLTLESCLEHEMSMRGALNMLGHINRNTGEEKHLNRLEALRNRKSDFTQSVYIAIVRISPPAILPFIKIDLGREAIQRVAAEYDWKIFQKYWTDEFGNVFDC
ncbi:MAG: hypothetical protein COA91_13885 [Robiginitomaculum sp.]|nr:MAG: hypothetical protein COA91_13885 [Robiginitomaculum sp.]